MLRPERCQYCCGQEWADYTSDCLPWLPEDRELDADSRYPGSHHFEKMTAGLYMGNLARLIILR
jgi:hexokinase